MNIMKETIVTNEIELMNLLSVCASDCAFLIIIGCMNATYSEEAGY